MSSDSSGVLDFQSLAVLVESELAAALAEAQRRAEELGLEVTSIGVKLGQGQPYVSENGSLSKLTLIGDRYPVSQRGWMLELEVEPRSRPKGLGLDAPTARAIFSPLPTSVVKGVNTQRRKQLSTWGISSVGELAQLDDVSTQRILRRQFTSILELQAKARFTLLSLPILPKSAADGRSILHLASLSEPGLEQLLGPRRVSKTIVRLLADYLAHLVVAIDTKVLRSIRFGRLREAALASLQSED